ncbi:hypothetical protein AVEN_217098-1 [Araneus ventricosus]|uniref:Uncharacterized protein n=1 Tax=Araneus ventricosus TaxID=182803 RepID=A0A4Y2WIZ9_ARAVE|nr:hypothetical protein AVEN_15264-1 [Araneus ventricosus]GBO37455.1 hypothetical protein AVEN_59643-1 [Araneus ventricosus]GBO37462.1 hypothetical protein AVEN_169019-1 [Araneus ventricosus]GBO37762.1 hypothetical protein AVEN_217098-1 [Araneus ventricosus]
MLLSSSVGLPFYIIALWESYKINENINEDPENQSLANESQDSSPLFDDSLLSNESSLERLNEFARLLNDQMSRRMRADLQRRASIANIPIHSLALSYN